jgi:hypothetical protein
MEHELGNEFDSEEAKKLLAEADKGTNDNFTKEEEAVEMPVEATITKVSSPVIETEDKSLGYINVNKNHLAAEKDWKNVPTQTLPSQGLFYPEDTVIVIKAALAAEIRHWSTIDESDDLSKTDAMNFVLDRCLRIQFNGQDVSSDNILEVARFYLVFAIRDFTFVQGQNKMFIEIPYEYSGKPYSD